MHGYGGRGFPLVHFSPQPEPFMSLRPCNHPAYPAKSDHVNVDACKPLYVGFVFAFFAYCLFTERHLKE